MAFTFWLFCYFSNNNRVHWFNNQQHWEPAARHCWSTQKTERMLLGLHVELILKLKSSALFWFDLLLHNVWDFPTVIQLVGFLFLLCLEHNWVTYMIITPAYPSFEPRNSEVFSLSCLFPFQFWKECYDFVTLSLGLVTVVFI